MIKQYVLQHYGVKVSVLYVAQIKRKYGQDMRENYNKSKKQTQERQSARQRKDGCRSLAAFSDDTRIRVVLFVA